MKLGKKALSAAITLGLVLGCYGNAWAIAMPILYGASPENDNYTISQDVVERDSSHGVVLNTPAKAITTGANFTVKGGPWMDVYGGYADSSPVSSNSVTINGGTISPFGSLKGAVYGGYAGNSTVSSNSVTINGGTIDGSSEGAVFGGYAVGGDVSSNSVTINGGSIGNAVYGGYTYAQTSGSTATATSGNANSNTVTISGGTINKNLYGGYTYAESQNGATAISGDANYNTVTMRGGSVVGSVYGGYTNAWSVGGDDASSGYANNNTVNISDGTVSEMVYGGFSYSAVNDNTVNISGGTINDKVYGGLSEPGEASGNTVNIYGGTINGEVYGGVAFNCTSNIISLGGYIDNGVISANQGIAAIGGDVYGGRKSLPFGSNSGNTLNVLSVGNNVYGVGASSFQNMNFYIPTNATTASDPMLTSTNDVDLTGVTEFNVVTTGTAESNVGYKVGETITLLSSTAGITIPSDGLTWKIDGVARQSKLFDSTVTNISNVQVKAGYDTSDAKAVTFKTLEYQLKADSYVSGNASLDGKLNLNNKTINMQEAEGTTAAYNTLTVKSLTGTGNLTIDANLANQKNDKLSVTGEGSDAVLNLSSIIVRSDGLTEGDNANALTYVTGSNINGITYTVGGSANEIKSATTDYIYTFTKGSDGKLNVAKESKGIKVGDFIRGQGSYLDVGSLTIDKDTAVKEAIGTTNTDASATSRTRELNLAVNAGKKLTKDSSVATTIDGITVAEGYTLNLTGQINGENKAEMSGFGTALTNNGTLNVKDMVLKDNNTDIENNAILNLSGINTVDNITGTGITNLTGGVTTVKKSLAQPAINISGSDTQLKLETCNAIELSDTSVEFDINAGNTNSMITSQKAVGGNATINTVITSNPDTSITLINSAEDSDWSNLNWQINGVSGKEKVEAKEITGITNVALAYGYDTSDAKNLVFKTEGYRLTDSSDVTNSVALDKSLNTKGKDITFHIANTVVSGDTMLNVAGSASLTGSAVKTIVETGSQLRPNDKINLIATTEGISGYDKTKAVPGKIVESEFKAYEMDIDVAGNKLVAKIIGDDTKEEKEARKSPVETQAVGINMLTAGGDMMSNEAMTSAASAVQADLNAGVVNVLTPFAVMGGASTRVNSGSHADVKSWNLNVGFSKEVKNNHGKLLFGPVVEYGRGSYDSYLDNGMKGEGNSTFIGVGVIAKQTNNNNVYYEGSIRGGRVNNDYKAVASGHSYDVKSAYYAAHAGLGKVFELKNKDSVDVYGKLFYTHMNGADTTLAGNSLELKAVDSLRSKLGARYNHKVNAKNTIYTGLAWQYEFKGDAEAVYDGKDTPTPSVKGHTGILELGWKVQPGAKDNFEVDLGVNGYTGVQYGVGANLKLNWKF